MISEEVVVELATVEVNDDYRVEVTLLHRVMDFNPDQARALAAELSVAADRADWLLVEHVEEAEARQADSAPVGLDGRRVF